MSTATPEPVPVTFWFDPSCPFTWMTSRWMLEVAEQRPLDITWRVMSSAIANEGNEVPAEFVPFVAAAWKGARVAVAVGEDHDSDTLGRFYTALGQRSHVGGQLIDEELILKALAEVGLPSELAAAADDPAYDGAVRASHAESQAAAGDTFGSPVVAIEGRAFFGPVVTPIPRGVDALRLFDGLRNLSAVPQFAELKRARNGPPDFS